MHEGAVRCQVPGCEEAIPNTRRFFSRYKICPFHSGCESVLIGGKEQRFCQLCRRFQDITEFEGDKRSCKASLNQHNQRRQLRRRAKAAAAASGVPAAGAAAEPAKPSQLEASQLPSPSTAASPTNSNSTAQASGGQQQSQQQQQQQQPQQQQQQPQQQQQQPQQQQQQPQQQQQQPQQQQQQPQQQQQQPQQQQQQQRQQEQRAYFTWVDPSVEAGCQLPAARLGQPFVFEGAADTSRVFAAVATGGVGGAPAATRAESITSPQQEGSMLSAEALLLLPPLVPQPEQTLEAVRPSAMLAGATFLGLSQPPPPQQQQQHTLLSLQPPPSLLQQPPPQLLPPQQQQQQQQQQQPCSPASPAAAGPAMPRPSPGKEAIMATSADDDMLGWLPNLLSMSIDDGQLVQPQCSLLQELLERQQQQQEEPPRPPAAKPAAGSQGLPLAQPRGGHPITAIDLRGIRRSPAAASWAALQPPAPNGLPGATGGEPQQFTTPLSAYVLPPAWMLQQAAAAAGGGGVAGAALPPAGWPPGSSPSSLGMGQEAMHGAGTAGSQPGDMPPHQNQAPMPGGLAGKQEAEGDNGNPPLPFAALAAAYAAAGGVDGTAPAFSTDQDLSTARGSNSGNSGSRKRPAAHSITLADLSLQLGSLELGGLGNLSALSSLDFGFLPAGMTNTASPPGDGLPPLQELPAPAQAGLQQYQQQQDGQHLPAFVFQAQAPPPLQQQQGEGAAQQQQEEEK